MRKIVITVFTLFSVFLFALPVFAYKSPGNPSGFVNDFAGILSQETKDNLENELKNYTAQEFNEITVVSVSSLDGEEIEPYAVELFEEWKIGKAKQDNGVLLLVAPNERTVRIEVGYGLEGALTDLESKLIIERILIPAFKTGDFNGGVAQAVGAIMEATKGEYTLPPGPNSLKDKINLNSISGGSLFFIIIMIAELISLVVRRMARSKTIWPGALTGGLVGGIIGLIISASLGFLALFLIFGGGFGLLIDYLLSRTKLGQNIGRGGRGGGSTFFGGGFGGGGGSGFGGFGGGSSGGGGGSGKW